MKSWVHIQCSCSAVASTGESSSPVFNRMSCSKVVCITTFVVHTIECRKDIKNGLEVNVQFSAVHTLWLKRSQRNMKLIILEKKL